MLSVPLWYRYPNLIPTIFVPFISTCDSSFTQIKPPLRHQYCAFIVIILARIHLSSQIHHSTLDNTCHVNYSVKSISKSASYPIQFSVLMAAEELPIPTIDDITRLTQNVSCADNRLALHMTSPNHEISNLLLIGRILSRCNFHAPVLHEIVLRAWNPSCRISVRKVDRNTFVFSFEHETDRALAYNRRPWTICGAHLVLKIWSPDLALTEIDFASSTFWIQVHGLPPIWYNKENIKLIGDKAGSVVEVEFSDAPSGMWRRFARVRVNINVNKPLCPGIFLPRHERTDIWISLKYKRLPKFCFRCGIMGHTEVHCESNRVVLTNEYGRKFSAFGDWLHCGNDKTLPGIYEKPSVVLVPTVVQDVPAIVQKTQLAKMAVQATENAVQCEDTPRTAGNDNLGHSRFDAGQTTGQVLSFARLLEQSLKAACRDNTASTSLSPAKTRVFGVSSECDLGSKISHQVGPSDNDPQSPSNNDPQSYNDPHSHNDPQSPSHIHLVKPTMSNQDTPCTDPREDHHLNLSILSQVRCSLESSLDQLRPHITNSTEPHDTENKANFLIASNHTPVNPPTPAPENQAENPPKSINQTATPLILALQEDIGTQDLKRKEHPDSPTTTPKKPRYENICFESSCSQIERLQLPATEVEEDCVSLVKETEMHPSPKAL